MKKSLICLCLLLLLGLSACQSGAPTAEKQDALEKVTLVLDYVPNTNHTGFYVAKDKGYFAEEGLDVEIIEPGDGAVTTLIAAGKGDFGISYQEDVTYARTSEEALPVKAIAAIIQHNTSGFASFRDKNITRPRDFEGRVYSGWGSPAEEAIIKAVMTADGGDFSKLKMVTSDGSGYASLRDKVDVMWFFWAWDGISSQREGLPVNYMELRQLDPRLDYYTPVIIANEDTLNNKGGLTKKFLRAVSKGYDFSINQPEEAAKILAQNVPEYDLAMLTESQKYLAEKYAEGVDRWGEMKDSVWAGYTDFMLEYGLIPKSIAPQDCYTNEFLPE